MTGFWISRGGSNKFQLEHSGAGDENSSSGHRYWFVVADFVNISGEKSSTTETKCQSLMRIKKLSGQCGSISYHQSSALVCPFRLPDLEPISLDPAEPRGRRLIQCGVDEHRSIPDSSASSCSNSTLHAFSYRKPSEQSNVCKKGTYVIFTLDHDTKVVCLFRRCPYENLRFNDCTGNGQSLQLELGASTAIADWCDLRGQFWNDIHSQPDRGNLHYIAMIGTQVRVSRAGDCSSPDPCLGAAGVSQGTAVAAGEEPRGHWASQSQTKTSWIR